MQSRTLWLLLAAVLLVCVIAGIRSCAQTSTSENENAAETNAGTAVTAPPDPASEAEAARRREEIRQYERALYAAVATLQRYLTALGGDDRAKADAFWVNASPPADSGEADLRTLKDLRSLRIENGKPEALDSAPVPSALQIPVELRVSIAGSPMRRYRGWYRLRRSVDGEWVITSASVDAVERPE